MKSHTSHSKCLEFLNVCIPEDLVVILKRYRRWDNSPRWNIPHLWG